MTEQTPETVALQFAHHELDEVVRVPQRTIDCVKALKGLNPEAVGKVVEALRGVAAPNVLPTMYNDTPEDVVVKLLALGHIVAAARLALAALEQQDD